MTQITREKPLLLLVEDEASLLKDITEIAGEEGWDIVTATSVESAHKRSEDHKNEVTLVLVDYMIPLWEKDADRVAALREDRRKRVLAWDKENRGGEPGREASEAFKASIEVIDGKLEPLVDVDGGITFLKQIAESGIGKDWNVAIFTARDREKGGLEQKAKKALEPFQLRRLLWKPVDPEDMAELLNEVADLKFLHPSAP